MTETETVAVPKDTLVKVISHLREWSETRDATLVGREHEAEELVILLEALTDPAAQSGGGPA